MIAPTFEEEQSGSFVENSMKVHDGEIAGRRFRKQSQLLKQKMRATQAKVE